MCLNEMLRFLIYRNPLETQQERRHLILHLLIRHGYQNEGKDERHFALRKSLHLRKVILIAQALFHFTGQFLCDDIENKHHSSSQFLSELRMTRRKDEILLIPIEWVVDKKKFFQSMTQKFEPSHGKVLRWIFMILIYDDFMIKSTYDFYEARLS